METIHIQEHSHIHGRNHEPFLYKVILSESLPLAKVILDLSWGGAGKTDKNAHTSTVNFAVLPSLSDTISLSTSVYSESSTHPSTVIIFMLAVIIYENYIYNVSEN